MANSWFRTTLPAKPGKRLVGFYGGLYAVSLTGNAEGHINLLTDRNLCP